MNKIVAIVLAFVLCASCQRPQSVVVAPQTSNIEAMVDAPAFSPEYYCQPHAGYDNPPSILPVCDPEIFQGINEECVDDCKQAYRDSVHHQFEIMCGAATAAHDTYVADKAACGNDLMCKQRVNAAYVGVLSAYTTYHNGKMDEIKSAYKDCLETGGPFGQGCCILYPPVPAQK